MSDQPNTQTQPIDEWIWIKGYAAINRKKPHEHVKVVDAYVSEQAAKSSAGLVYPRIEWREVIDKEKMAVQLELNGTSADRLTNREIREKCEETGSDPCQWTFHYGYPLGFKLERSGEHIAIVHAVKLREWWDNRVWQPSSMFDPQKEFQKLHEEFIRQAQRLKALEKIEEDVKFTSRLLSEIKMSGREHEAILNLAVKTLKVYDQKND